MNPPAPLPSTPLPPRVAGLIAEARLYGRRWSEEGRALWRRRLDRACAGKHEIYERALRAVTGGRGAAW